MTPERRHDLYWLGYRYGKALSEHMALTDHQPELRLDLTLVGNTRHRAYALGALRGYRQAAGLPEPLMGHRILS